MVTVCARRPQTDPFFASITTVNGSPRAMHNTITLSIARNDVLTRRSRLKLKPPSKPTQSVAHSNKPTAAFLVARHKKVTRVLVHFGRRTTKRSDLIAQASHQDGDLFVSSFSSSDHGGTAIRGFSFSIVVLVILHIVDCLRHHRRFCILRRGRSRRSIVQQQQQQHDVGPTTPQSDGSSSSFASAARSHDDAPAASASQ
jgi:hypothetical protein